MARSLIVFAAGVIATLLVTLGAWLIIVYAGLYNIAATDPHADVVRWSFETTLHRSVARRASTGAPPAEQAGELDRAAGTYASTCAHCHGAPGMERPKWATNMRPEPPDLAEAASHWEPREIFWIVKNGIKMSGMPAFGPGHDDPALWGITAFVAQLPAMSPEEYEALAGSGHGDNGDSH